MSELDVETLKRQLQSKIHSDGGAVWIPHDQARALVAALEQGQRLGERLRRLRDRIAEELA